MSYESHLFDIKELCQDTLINLGKLCQWNPEDFCLAITITDRHKNVYDWARRQWSPLKSNQGYQIIKETENTNISE